MAVVASAAAREVLRATTAAAWVLLCACGGVRTGLTQPGALQHRPLPVALATMSLQPLFDTFVTNQDGFEMASLADERWVAAGADGEGKQWVSWMQFDLGVCADIGTPRSVTLTLHEVEPGAVDREVDEARFGIYSARGEWPALNWNQQPGRSSEPIATVVALAGSGTTTVDLTEWFVDEVAAGTDVVMLGIVPLEPETSFRIFWSSREGTNIAPELDIAF